MQTIEIKNFKLKSSPILKKRGGTSEGGFL